MNPSEDTLTTVRVPVGTDPERARLPDSPLKPVGGSPSEVSVTQAVRIRRSRRRVPISFGAPAREPVPPWLDALFPALVSLVLTVPSALHLWHRDLGAAVMLVPLLGVIVTFGVVASLSRGLDRTPDD